MHLPNFISSRQQKRAAQRADRRRQSSRNSCGGGCGSSEISLDLLVPPALRNLSVNAIARFFVVEYVYDYTTDKEQLRTPIVRLLSAFPTESQARVWIGVLLCMHMACE